MDVLCTDRRPCRLPLFIAKELDSQRPPYRLPETAIDLCTKRRCQITEAYASIKQQVVFICLQWPPRCLFSIRAVRRSQMSVADRPLVSVRCTAQPEVVDTDDHVTPDAGEDYIVR